MSGRRASVRLLSEMRNLRPQLLIRQQQFGNQRLEASVLGLQRRQLFLQVNCTRFERRVLGREHGLKPH